MNLLAFDTATEQMSVALAIGDDEVASVEGAGGAQASATLIPTIMALLAQAGVRLRDLDAIAFGRGPGAFTGLRTACAVAQGLAFGIARPVLPIDTLLGVAESARSGRGPRAGDDDFSVWALLDARMDQIYAARYRHRGGHGWETLDAPMLTDAEALNERWQAEPPQATAGRALTTFAGRLRTPEAAMRYADAAPRASGLLPLALALWRAGGAVDPALALPLYLRDKVAQTTEERRLARDAKAAATSATTSTTPPATTTSAAMAGRRSS